MAQAYKVDFTTRTVTITAEFEKAMSNPEAAEYKIIRQLCADFPGMRIVKRTHRTPTHYTSKNGEKSACNPYKNLTYEKMERFMDALPNGAEYRKQYDFLKTKLPLFRLTDTAPCANGSLRSSPSTAKIPCSISPKRRKSSAELILPSSRQKQPKKRRTHKQIQSKHLTVVNNVNIKC